MPEPKHSPRTLTGALATKIGSYAASTIPQLHGHGSNKTAAFLAALDPHDPGTQGFYREALTVPHPLELGKTLTYGQLQQLMRGPQKAAALEAYRAAHRLPQTTTSEAYQQAQFDAAHQQLLARGAAHPDTFAFPEAAVEALRAPTSARLIRTGNFVSGEQPAQATNAPMQAQRFGNLPADVPLMAAPGMAVRLVRGAGPAPTSTPARTIPGTIASR